MNPADLRYAETHEWIRNGDPATIGITQYAQEEMGDLVFVELPDVGRTLKAGENLGSVESVKTVSDVYMPAGGEIVAVNGELANRPELVNSDPYGQGWLIQVRLSDPSELDKLMDAAAYEQFITAQH